LLARQCGKWPVGWVFMNKGTWWGPTRRKILDLVSWRCGAVEEVQVSGADIPVIRGSALQAGMGDADDAKGVGRGIWKLMGGGG